MQMDLKSYVVDSKPENSKELVYFRISVKEWSFRHHFGKDATYTPDVHRS